MVPGSLEGESWCNEQMIHERLDIIEEKVIKTVEHLESEVKSLLNIISETTSNIPTFMPVFGSCNWLYGSGHHD
uniref:Placenta-specific protein 9 n=1 Tax=Malurus cyaneus samueli TaxID=2593467 RepID=A0A8C5TGV1_9PASS